jgi:hypothetical protein
VRLLRLLHSLFPRDREGLGLSPELEDLLDSANEDNPLTLPALQAVGKHQLRSFRSSSAEFHVRPHKPGDYGYFTEDSTDLSDFVVLGNVQDGECVKEMKHVIGETDCTMFMWRHDPVRCHRNDLPAVASLVPDERECWEVPLLENDASIR